MNYQKSKQCCNIRSSFSLLFIILFSGILFANNPKKKKISDEMKLSGVALITSDTVEVHNGSIVTLPIRITSSQILGAVSLIINYTDNLIQINAVNSPVMSGMITNVANSKIYLAWNNFQGINLAANDILLNIEIQVTTDDIASIDFSLDPNCELADINANVLNGIQLSIPELVDDSSIITNVQLAICSNDSIFVGGAWQNTAGTYYDTLQTTQALDSIIITILTINLSDTSYR